MLQIVNHGGHCCGIKHIFGFPTMPSYNTPALIQTPVSHGASAEMRPGVRFSPGPEPEETGEVRLDKLLAYLDKNKESHLAEVVMSYNQINYWRVCLEARGFKEVSKFENSNTDATLYVFHRVTPLPKPKKEK